MKTKNNEESAERGADGGAALPEGVRPGERVEVQLAPLGAYPQVVDGRTVTQVVDEEAARRIVAAFREDVLVDRDHDSEEGRGTEAQAWVKALRLDPDRGLVGVFEFTDRGAEAVANRRFRFVSPAWTLDADGRPKELVSVALTNRPNLPVAPVLNMRMPGADGAAEPPAVPANTQEEGDPNMDQIRQRLGLPPEATEEEVLAAVDALKAAVDAAAEKARNAEAEAFARENADVAENAEELAEQYKADPEGTRRVVANCRRMMERVVANARADAERASRAAETARAALNRRVADPAAAREPVALNAVQRGLAARATPEEQNQFILAHAGEL